MGTIFDDNITKSDLHQKFEIKMFSLIKVDSFILIAVLSSFDAVIGSEDNNICPTRAIDFEFNATLYPDLYKPLMNYNTSSEEIPLTDMKRDPNEPVTAEALASAGVSFLYDLDPLEFNYPAKEKPWTQFLDPKVAQIANASTFLFSDILTITQFYSKFWDEHFHGGSSIRYILNGTGFFDIRDLNDEWVRVKVSTGDFMQFPAGLSHRFSVDESKYIHVMRFSEAASTEWTAYSRSNYNSTNNIHRKQYEEEYLCGGDGEAGASPSSKPLVSKTPKGVGKGKGGEGKSVKSVKADKMGKTSKSAKTVKAVRQLRSR